SVENRHTIDGATLIVARGRIGHVIGPDYQCDVGLWKLAIDVIHLKQLLIWNVSFGQQDIHVARHASGNGVDGKADVHAPLGQRVIERSEERRVGRECGGRRAREHYSKNSGHSVELSVEGEEGDLGRSGEEA